MNFETWSDRVRFINGRSSDVEDFWRMVLIDELTESVDSCHPCHTAKPLASVERDYRIMNQLKWQPVVLVLEGRRLECSCGALATFVTGKMPATTEEYNVLDDVDAWCQECFAKAQEEE